MFVILGLVILFSVFTVIFIANSSANKNAEVSFRKYSGPIDRGQIQSFVENCIDSSVRPAIHRMAIQGGYLNIPVEEFYMPSVPVTGLTPHMIQPVAPLTKGKLINIPYAYFNGESHFPTLERMEEELSYYAKDEIKRCFNSFAVFNHDLIFLKNTHGFISEDCRRQSYCFSRL